MLSSNRISIVFIFAAFLLFLLACAEETEKITPQHQSITESVYASAHVEPADYYEVYAAARGIVDQVYLKEGALLKQGDSILKLVDYPSNYQKANAALEVDFARTNLDGASSVIQELEHELEVAVLKFQSDSLNYQRQIRLRNKKIGSEQEFEQIQLNYENSRKKVHILKQQIERKRDELETQLKKAQNNYANQLSINQEYLIKSRIEGTLYELKKEEGESVHEQEVLAYIGSSDQFILKLQVDEVDIVRLKEGQKIWLSLDAYEGDVFEATVQTIIPKMNDATQTFWVEGVFVNPPNVLYAGLRGEANVVIAEKENALCIPRSYLFLENQIITEKGTLQIETGLKDLQFVEILTPLDSSIQILKP